MEFTVVREAMCYIILTLAVIGWIGSILTIVVLRKMFKKYSSTAIFFTAIAITDMIILTFYSFKSIIYLFDIPVYTNTVLCKLIPVLRNGCLQTSSWLLAAVTLERVIHVLYPQSARKICGRQLSKGIVATIVIIVYGYNSVIEIYIGRVYLNTSYYTGCTIPDTNRYMKLFSWVNMCSWFFIPFLFIVTGNSIIVYHVMIKRRRQTRHINRQSQNGRLESSLTVSLVLISIVFILTIAPDSLYLIFLLHFKNVEWFHFDPLALIVTPVLPSLNAVCNFYLYFLSGSKFRAELKNLLWIWCCKHCK